MELKYKNVANRDWYEIVYRTSPNGKWKCHVKFWELWKVFCYPTYESAHDGLMKINRKKNVEYAIRHCVYKNVIECGSEYFMG